MDLLPRHVPVVICARDRAVVLRACNENSEENSPLSGGGALRGTTFSAFNGGTDGAVRVTLSSEDIEGTILPRRELAYRVGHSAQQTINRAAHTSQQ